MRRLAKKGSWLIVNYIVISENYLEDNQLQQNSTCMIYFSENRKKLEKEATKILNKYKKNNRMTVSRIDSDKFRFTKPEE